MTIRIGVGQAARATEEYLAFASQLGVGAVQLNTPDLPGAATLGAGRPGRPAGKGRGLWLSLEAIENVPNAFYEECHARPSGAG